MESISPFLNESTTNYGSYFVSKYNEENFRKVAEALTSNHIGVFRTKRLIKYSGLSQYKITHMMPIFIKAGMVEVFSTVVHNVNEHTDAYYRNGQKYFRYIVYKNLIFGRDLDSVMKEVKDVSTKFDEVRWRNKV